VLLTKEQGKVKVERMAMQKRSSSCSEIILTKRIEKKRGEINDQNRAHILFGICL
jgi:hypothetical protein